MHIACWETKATNTYSEYVKLIDFALQKWLHGRAPFRSMPVLFTDCVKAGLCLRVQASSSGQTVVNKSVQRLATG